MLIDFYQVWVWFFHNVVSGRDIVSMGAIVYVGAIDPDDKKCWTNWIYPGKGCPTKESEVPYKREWGVPLTYMSLKLHVKFSNPK